MTQNSALTNIAQQFAIPGKLDSIVPLKRGHINDTYLSVWTDGSKSIRYIHQKINHNVFRDVPGLMRNIEIVCAHLKKKLAAVSSNCPEDLVLTLIPTRQSKTYFADSNGEYWRTYLSIENCLNYDLCPNRQVGLEAAKACARFDKMLIDLDPKLLVDTIPGFHDAAGRFSALETAIKKDDLGRVKECGAEIEFVQKRTATACLISSGLKSGTIPKYSVHNDTKLNNVLFSKNTGRGIAIVDLDTCMAGTLLYDFGDLTKHLVIVGKEDEQDLTKLGVNIDYFAAAVEGYLSEIGTLMKPEEINLLANSLKTFALVLGARFLTDYLQGDTYFKTERPGHNLSRCRAQLALVKELEKHEAEMERAVTEISTRLGLKN